MHKRLKVNQDLVKAKLYVVRRLSFVVVGVCARVVAGRYYKGKQINTTLIRFLDSWRSCRSCRPKGVKGSA